MIKLHPHAIGQIMGDAKSLPDNAPENIKAIASKKTRTDEEKRTLAKYKDSLLSETAKTYLRNLAKQHCYGFKPKLNTKPIRKGLACENDSIDLLNAVLFTDYTKNTERLENEWLTGEADLVGDDCIIDIKSSWSLETFHATPEDGENSDYEHQLRAYMMLYDKPRATLAYCLVSTPDELIGYEAPEVHKVDHIEPAMRVTLLHFTRDLEFEAKMVEKCKAAQLYVEAQIEAIKQAHRY